MNRTQTIQKSLNIFTVLGVISLLLIYIGGRWIWQLDLVSHFAMQIGLFTSTWAIVCILVNKARNIKIVYTILAIVGILPVATLLTNKTQVDTPSIYYQNILYYNLEIEKSIEDILKTGAETVALVEIPEQLHEQITDKYKYAHYESKGGQSCAIYSNIKPISSKTIELEYPVCTTQFENYTLYVVHPYPPLSEKLWLRQSALFMQLEELIENEKGLYAIVGDFNSTPFSPLFRAHLGKYGGIYQNTWAKDTLYTLPIDHILTNIEYEVEVTDSTVSDHGALLIELPEN